jgi:proteic killer suppression protein
MVDWPSVGNDPGCVRYSKLDQINRVTRLDALRIPPGNELKALKGTEAGFYQIRVNDQYRIRFAFREEHFHDVCCKDFH